MVTDNIEIIHRAMGCKADGSVERGACKFGHKDARGAFFKPHPSFGIRGDFWNAADAAKAEKESRKKALMGQLAAIKAEETITDDDKMQVLSALGIESYPMPLAPKPDVEKTK